MIFRINDDGSAPSDNPFFSQGGNLAKYFAYGIRNGFGLAFDSVTDKLWNTENGPATYDEVNLVEPGFNSGWKQIMGPSSRDAQGTTDLVIFPGSHYAEPKFSWFSVVGPTAIVFTNAATLGVDYQDSVVVGDINNGNLYRFRLNPTRDGFIFTNPNLGDLVADNNTELSGTHLGDRIDGGHGSQDWSGWTALRSLFFSREDFRYLAVALTSGSGSFARQPFSSGRNHRHRLCDDYQRGLGNGNRMWPLACDEPAGDISVTRLQTRLPTRLPAFRTRR